MNEAPERRNVFFRCLCRHLVFYDVKEAVVFQKQQQYAPKKKKLSVLLFLSKTAHCLANFPDCRFEKI